MLHFIRACIIAIAEIIIGCVASVGMIAIGVVGTAFLAILFHWEGIRDMWVTFYDDTKDMWVTLLGYSVEAFED